LVSMLGVALASGTLLAETPKQRLNPVISLIEQGKPVVGLYAPGHPPPGDHDALPTMPAPERAKQAIAYKATDYVFDGSMEYDFDRAFPAFAKLAGALKEAGALSRKPYPHLTHPLFA